MAREVNPLMRWAYQTSPLSFMLAKLAMVQLGVLLLRFNHSARVAGIAEKAGAAIYVSVMVYHLSFIADLPA